MVLQLGLAHKNGQEKVAKSVNMEAIRSFYKKTVYKKYFKPMKMTYDFFIYRILPEKIFLKLRFKQTFGYDLDLNNPKTFNEKMQWLKLNDRTPLHTLCADKLEVRHYIKSKVGEKHLVPLIFKRNIHFKNLYSLPELYEWYNNK